MLWWDNNIIDESIQYLEQRKSDDIKISNVHFDYTNCNDLWNSDGSIRQKEVIKYKNWLYLCNKYHIPIAVIHLTRRYSLDKPNQYGLDSIREIVNLAEQLNIKIAIENTRRDNFLECILDNISSPNLGMCYDSSHANLWSKTLCCLLDKYNERIFATHLSDNHGKLDDHLPLGQGEIDFDIIFTKLKEISYKGDFSLEIVAKENDDKLSPEEFLRIAKNKIGLFLY